MKLKLKGHQTFGLREGWIYKGLNAVKNDERIFSSNNAPDVMGVGSTMVKAIKYWLVAFKLMKYSQKNGYVLTEFGRCILDNDPYLEMNFTVCLLHYNIVKNISEAPSWYIFFNKCDIDYVNKKELENLMKINITGLFGDIDYSNKSLISDINVMLNMYCKEKTVDPEDNKYSPLSELKLLYKSEDNYYKRCIDSKRIDLDIVLYIILKYKEDNDVNTISIDNLYKDVNGLGNIYNMSRIMINMYLDELDNLEYIKVDRTAGLDVINILTDKSGSDVINDFYNNHSERQEI